MEYDLTELFAEFRRLKHKVDTLSGDGVVNHHDSIIVGNPQPQTTLPIYYKQPSIVLIQEPISGMQGRYKGLAFVPSLNANPTGNLSFNDFTNIPGSFDTTQENCFVYNPAEMCAGMPYICTLGESYNNPFVPAWQFGRVTISGVTWPVYIPIWGTSQGVIHVGLTCTNPSANGTNTSAPGYVYSAGSLGTGLSPEVGRQNGTFTPATKGIGYFIYEDGPAEQLFVLYACNEVKGTNACTGESS
jgi:hypothetical protein